MFNLIYRLELELGIKKPHGKDSTLEYSSNFNTNVIAYPSPPPQQQQQMMYRQQPTVVQVQFNTYYTIIYISYHLSKRK